MAYLKEDGSLDVKRISKLPSEEFEKVLLNLTEEQLDEYYSVLSESKSKPKPTIVPTKVNFRLEDALANGTLVDAEKFLNEMLEKYGK